MGLGASIEPTMDGTLFKEVLYSCSTKDTRNTISLLFWVRALAEKVPPFTDFFFFGLMTLKLPPPTSCSNPVESQFVETFTRYFVPMICLSCPIAAFCHWFAGVHRKSTNAQDRCLAPVCHCWGGSQKLNK